MKDTKKSHVRITDYMVSIGFALGVFYWFFEAFFNMFVAKSGLNPFQLLVTPESNISWTRMIVLCLFVIFGAHAQFIMNERNQALKKNEQDAATRERFQRLLSPNLSEMVVSGQLKVEKGGENRVATVMFADVRNFTKMSERTDAKEVLKILNEYFEIIVDIVFLHEGTVDKFIGDEIMAIWGAPVTHDNDPARAIHAAIEIQSALAEFNKNRASEGQQQIQFGIAINTGNLVAGYIGSTRTMSYSVIGNVVNVAHGICPAAKAGEIVISESTCNQVRNSFELTKLEPVQAKGKGKLIQIFKVLGEKQPSMPA
jgi:adenylate cyclase